MVDKVKKGENNIGDEYQLSDDNQFSSNSTQPGEGKRIIYILNSVKVKYFVLILIAVLLAILAIYEVVDYFIPARDNATAEQPVVQEALPVVNTPQSIEHAPPIKKVMSDDSEERLAALEDQVALREDEINSVIISLSSIQKSSGDLSHQIQGLQRKLNELSQQVNNQQTMIEQLQEDAQAAVEENRVVYYIQAIIPGRAWLKGSDGSTMTVRTGSKIPDYGIVSIIDVNSATITMSNDEVIGYDPNDS